MDYSTLIFIALLGLLGYYVFATRNAIKAGQKKLHAQRSKKQSVEVGSPETVKIGDVVLNSTAPRRHEKAAKGMLTGWDDKITTLVQMFDYTVSKSADLPCLGSRPIVAGKAGPFEFQSYKQISIRRDNLASGLKALTGLKFGDCIGIYSINRPEWVITDLACHKFGFPSISLYDTLGANAVEYIVNHAEIRTCVCAGKQLDIMLTVAKSSKSLKYLISMDPLTEKQRDAARVANVSVWEFTEVEKQGVASPQQPDRVVKPNDVYTIMYTSGTTGNPKGVVHTNANYIAEVAGIREHQEGLFAATDVHLSYLPLAHSFERIVYMTMMSYGAQVGFFQGNLQELFNDIAELRPTFLVGAPRVWQRLQEKLLSTIAASPFIRRTLFQIGFNQKKEALKNGMSTPIWDKILFSKTKARLGGRVGWILTGSAPLDPALGEFLKVCFCCPILEGYGLTENAAGACATFLDETQLGHVGPPFPCCEVKLVDVPEMNYSAKATPPKGEIWIRGPNIFREYLKEPKKTEEVLFADGWFATGDIGRFNENGSLSIIDRKKNIFKLMQGEYVAVEFLEGVFKRSQFVGQIWVYGSSFKRFLISVVVPNWDFVIPWAKSQGISDLSEDGLAANPKLKQAILDDLTKTGKAAQIQPFEHVKAVHIFAKPFSVDNDLTTPTFKLKRPQLKEYFTKQIDEMYKAIGE